MKPNVDTVTLISLNELSTATVPTGADFVYFEKNGVQVGRKLPISLLGAVISEQIGTAINRPDRVYQPGVSMPEGATIVNDDDDQPTILEDSYLDGLEYSVHLRGIEWMVKGQEWQNDVEDGGFRWTDGRIFEDGQVITVSFKPQISSVISTPDAVARFLDQSGIYTASATQTLTASQQRKLIYIAGATAVVTITLDATYPEGVLCVLLTADGVQKQTKIQAPAGHTIYQNGAKSLFVLGQADYAYLVRYGTSWYVTSIGDSWQRVGQMVLGGIPGPNCIAANRQDLQESEYPRLALHLDALEVALPGSVVSAANQAANPTKWARGGGVIWVPRPGGNFLRFLDLGANVDPDRTTPQKNQMGSAQGWAIANHAHPITNNVNDLIVKRRPGGPGVAGLNNVNGFEGYGSHYVLGPVLPDGNAISTSTENRPINAAYPALIYV